MSDELIVQDAPTQLVSLPRLDVVGIQRRVADIETLIDSIMVKGVHYGQPYPGSPKESLLQAGAELMFEAFNLVADPEPREEKLDGGHLRVICEGCACAPDGRLVGRITAECSTMEPKYRYRKQGRVCPSCGQDAIMKSKYPDKITGEKGWYCNRKSGGCGDQFGPEEKAIVDQTPGRIEHPDPAELWHTVRMMAQKRWAVALARRTFALSARFVDEEAAQSAPFDASKAGAILRAIPGERRAKWNRCISFCLTSFGKGPKDLNQLEGAVFLRWLGEQVTEASEFKPEDFGESPEVATADPPPSTSGEPAPGRAPLDVDEVEPAPQAPELSDAVAELAIAIEAAGQSDAVAAEYGPPGAAWELNRPAIEERLKRKS